MSPLAAAPVSHTMAVGGVEVAPDFLLLPDAPAVVVFESADGRTILIATTASARDLARRRLAPPGTDEAPRSARPDLRSLCTGGKVHAIGVGSSLEADAVYLHQARTRVPHLARVVAERWRPWFVHVDGDAEFPQWTKTNLAVGLVGKRAASRAIGGNTLPHGLILGPLPDKDAAGRLIETLTDVFDLCRFHHLLLQAPLATACAYKEMGRCAAPCDGSETMDSYRQRTRQAAQSLTLGARATIDSRRPALARAAAEERFEDAAAIQKEIARLQSLDKPAFSQIRSLKSWIEFLLLPGAAKGSTTAVLFDRGRLLRAGEIDPQRDETTCATIEAITRYRASVTPGDSMAPMSMDEDMLGAIGIFSRWLFLPKTKRRGETIPLADAPPDPAMIRDVATKLSRAKSAAPPLDTHEIEP